MVVATLFGVMPLAVGVAALQGLHGGGVPEFAAAAVWEECLKIRRCGGRFLTPRGDLCLWPKGA